LESNWIPILAFVVVFLHLAVGILFYTFVEGWHPTDALYFTAVTLTTVGYGDFYPHKPISKIFTMFFILSGVAFAGFVLGSIANWIIMRQEKAKANLLLDQDRVGFTSLPKSRISPAQRKLIISTVALIFVIGLGAGMVHVTEGFDLLDSIYWSVVTCSTVGYGDLAPKGRSMKVFTAFFTLIGTFLVVSSLGRFADVFIEHHQKKRSENILRKQLTLSTLTEMDTAGCGTVTQQEFLEYMLCKMGKCCTEDLIKIKEQFDTLDVDGTGFLDEHCLQGLQIVGDNESGEFNELEYKNRK